MNRYTVTTATDRLSTFDDKQAKLSNRGKRIRNKEIAFKRNGFVLFRKKIQVTVISFDLRKTNVLY